jgi:osmoprotectant transport system permease protein
MTWLVRNWQQVLIALGEHVLISLVALAISFTLAMLIGVWAARRPRVLAAACSTRSRRWRCWRC